MNSAYSLTTLGDQTCVDPTGNAIPISTTAFLLLTYVCLHDKGTSRGSVGRVFWPRTQSKSARHSLSQVLYYLKKRLPQLQILSERDFVRVPRSSVEVDVHRVMRATNEGQWAVVRSLCKGRFLESLDFPFSAELEYWCEEIDATLNESRYRALEDCVQLAERSGEWADVEAYARQLVTRGLHRDVAYSQLSRALVAQGRRREAVKVVEAAAGILGPHWAEQELQLLREHTERHASAPDSETRFFGRAVEFCAIRSCWDAVKAGSSMLVLIHGEAGIGKTRLATQLKKLALLQGGIILSTRCYESGHRVSYAPLGNIAHNLPTRATEDLPYSCRQVMRLLAGQDGNQVTQGEQVAAVRDSDDIVTSAFVGALARLSEAHPVLLFVDDCQWLDAATADLLVYVTSRLPQSRILILCAARTDTRGSPGLRAIEAAARDRVVVSELTPVECDGLARSYMSANEISIEEDITAKIVRLAGGNPLFLLELLGSSVNLSSGCRRPAVPSSITGLLQRKYEELSEDARRLAGAAAVLERHATVALAREVAELGNSRILPLIDELAKAGLIQDSEARCVSLKHDLIRETISGFLPFRTRRFMHARAAKALMRRKAPPSIVAYHADLGGLKRRAWSAAIEAGDRALSLSAHGDVLHWYEVAHRSARDCERRNVASRRILEYAMSFGTPEQAEPYVEELLPVYKAAGDELGVIRCEHVHLVGKALRNAVPAPQLAKEMLSAGERAERAGDGDLAVRVFRDLASILQHSSTRNELLSVIDRMLATVGKCEVARMAQVYAFAAVAYANWGERTVALELAETAVSMADGSNDTHDVIHAYSARGSVRAANGMLREGCEDYLYALQAADQSGVFQRRSVIEVNYGVVLMDMGRYEEGERMLLRARGVGDQENPYALANLAYLYYETGKFDRAEPLIAACSCYANRLRSVWLTAETKALYGLIALARGDRTRAESACDELIGNIDDYVSISADPTHMVALVARVHAARAETDMALEIIGRARRILMNRGVLLNKRLDLERARVLIDRNPDGCYRLAKAVAEEAISMMAWPLHSQAAALLEEVQLRGR